MKPRSKRWPNPLRARPIARAVLQIELGMHSGRTQETGMSEQRECPQTAVRVHGHPGRRRHPVSCTGLRVDGL